MPATWDGDPTSVAVLDDQPLFVDGVAMALDGLADIELVLRATTVDGLLRALQRRAADVLLVEPWGQAGNGLECVGAVHDLHPTVSIVVLSHRSGRARVDQAVALGAQAYLSKATCAADLPMIIRHVAAGASMLPAASRRQGHADLTPRESEVLALAAEGMSNADLGRRLFVTERTVKFHLCNAFRKLGASNRTEAAHMARAHGLIG